MASDDPIATLRAAREKAVIERRNVAESLLQPYQRGQTERMHELFVSLQNTIESIDRALSDEKELAKDGPAARITIKDPGNG